MVAANRFDVAMSGITWRPERAVIGWTTRAVAQGGPCVVGDPSAGLVAVNRGGVLERWARGRFSADAIAPIDDNLSLAALLEGGAVAAFVTDSFEAPSLPLARAAARRCEPPRDRKVYWVAPARAQELGPWIDAWIEANEPRLDALRRRWLAAGAARRDRRPRRPHGPPDRADAGRRSVEARASAAVKNFQAAQGELSGALSRLLVVTENYPNLKSDQSFRDLQAQLEGTENRITVARGRYITTVQDYNTYVRSFPQNLTAMMFGYKQKPNFTVENEAQISEAPAVDFGTAPPPPAAPAPPAPTPPPPPPPPPAPGN